MEGVTDVKNLPPEKKEHGKKVAYAGKLVEAFGAKRLVKAFEMIDDPEASLHICGGGELKPYVEEMCQKDSRIHYYGVVPAEKANEILQNADVLVNPRQNDDEYTKYSFPSKNIEYLMTGNAVVAYMLDGIPEIYKDFFIVPSSCETYSLSEAICFALNESEQAKERKKQEVWRYLAETKEKEAVAERVVSLLQ